MKVQIGFQDQLLATGTIGPDGKVVWEGDTTAAPVVRYYYKPGMTGEDWLRKLLERLQGRWWCVEVPEDGLDAPPEPGGDDTAPFASERWPAGTPPPHRGGEFKPSEGGSSSEDVPTVYPPDTPLPSGGGGTGGTPADPPLRPGLRQHLDLWLKAANLPPEQAGVYGHAMATVLSRLSGSAATQIIKTLSSPGGGVLFKSTRQEVALFGRSNGLVLPPGAEDRLMGVCHSRKGGKSVICVDGPYPGKPLEHLAHMYAHEVAHALDWNDQWSSQADWRDAYAAEINRPELPLSRYGATAPHEGWAEFGRLVILNPKVARRDFPKCWAVWQRHDLT